MNRDLFNKSNKLEKFTFIFDIIAIIAYITLFLVFFGMLQYPIDPATGEVILEELEFFFPVYEFLGNNIPH